MAISDSLPKKVEIIEVGLRDGLQREAKILPPAEKVNLIQGLVASGIRHIQVTSFVHPRLVPQMADAEQVCSQLPEAAGVVYSGLALNLRGVERAQAAGLKHIDISVSASDAHSQRNANRTLAQARAEFVEMVSLAREKDLFIRGGIQCAFGYLNPRDVDPQTVLEIARDQLELGVDMLALADSAGLANPRQLADLLLPILDLAGDTPVVLHLHDTRGMGLANVLSALQCGVRHFDTSFGGLGGCPFITGATGNIPTEDTVHMLHELGIETGIDIAALSLVTLKLEGLLGQGPLPGKLYKLH